MTKPDNKKATTNVRMTPEARDRLKKHAWRERVFISEMTNRILDCYDKNRHNK